MDEEWQNCCHQHNNQAGSGFYVKIHLLPNALFACALCSKSQSLFNIANDCLRRERCTTHRINFHLLCFSDCLAIPGSQQTAGLVKEFGSLVILFCNNFRHLFIFNVNFQRYRPTVSRDILTQLQRADDQRSIGQTLQSIGNGAALHRIRCLATHLHSK